MNFAFRHLFQASRDQIAAAMFSSDYTQYLVKHHDTLLEAEVLDVEETEHTITRKIRYLPKPVIPSVGGKAVPPHWFAFIEHSTWNKRDFKLEFENIPMSQTVQNYLINRGTISLHALGTNQTERRCQGELKLKLPFLLKPLAPIGERLIHNEAEKILNGEATALKTKLKMG